MSKISKKSRKGMKEIFKATVNLCNWIYPTLGMVTPIQSAVTPISEIQSILCDAVSTGCIQLIKGPYTFAEVVKTAHFESFSSSPSDHILWSID